jgi:hypothetical protein
LDIIKAIILFLAVIFFLGYAFDALSKIEPRELNERGRWADVKIINQ